MDNILNLKHQPRRTFRRHFLASVHCEVRFEGNQLQRVLQARESLAREFSLLSFNQCHEVQQGEMALHQEVGQTPIIRQSSSVVGLSFQSAQPRREVQVLGDKIVISDFAYDGFDSFAARLIACFTMVAKVLGWNRNIVQVGLRKINQVRIEPASSIRIAADTFNPVLFAAVTSGICVDEATSAYQNAIVLERADHMGIIQAAIKRLPGATAFEATLDFDLIDKSVFNTSEALMEKLKGINSTHFDLFMWAVTDRLIAAMEG